MRHTLTPRVAITVLVVGLSRHAVADDLTLSQFLPPFFPDSWVDGSSESLEPVLLPAFDLALGQLALPDSCTLRMAEGFDYHVKVETNGPSPAQADVGFYFRARIIVPGLPVLSLADFATTPIQVQLAPFDGIWDGQGPSGAGVGVRTSQSWEYTMTTSAGDGLLFGPLGQLRRSIAPLIQQAVPATVGVVSYLGTVSSTTLSVTYHYLVPAGQAATWWIPSPHWTNLGGGIPGLLGIPSLYGMGGLGNGEFTAIALHGGPPLTPCFVVVGASAINLSFKGGTLVPAVDLLIPLGNTDSGGNVSGSVQWTTTVPSGATIFAQAWLPEATALKGFVASNALSVSAP